MKKIILNAVFFLLVGGTVRAQVLQPVKWSYAAKKISGKEAIVYIKATIDKGWHIYSQTVKEGGPVKTSFNFEHSKSYQRMSSTVEPKPITKMEKAFGMEVGFFENSVIFQQRIKLMARRVIVKGKLEYMTCNDQKCLPPEEIDFSIPIK
jgi:thiol:disulfide interchange protein DsbD